MFLLKIRSIILDSFEFGFKKLNFLRARSQVCLLLGIGALKLKEGCFFLDQESLQLLVLVFHRDLSLLKLLHLLCGLSLHPPDVVSKSVFNEFLFFSYDLLDRHLLVQLIFLILHHSLSHRLLLDYSRGVYWSLLDCRSILERLVENGVLVKSLSV